MLLVQVALKDFREHVNKYFHPEKLHFFIFIFRQKIEEGLYKHLYFVYFYELPELKEQVDIFFLKNSNTRDFMKKVPTATFVLRDR